MKNTTRFASLCLTLCLALCLALGFTPRAFGAPYGPKGKPAHHTQPSGAVLNLRVFGDHYYFRTETWLGHTVVFNKQTNAYHYAELSPDQKTLLPTAVLAEGNPPKGTPLHLDILPSEIAKIRKAADKKINSAMKERWKKTLLAAQERRKGNNSRQNAAAPATVTGNVVGLTMLIQFPGENFPVARTKMASLLNDDTYTQDGNTSSVKGYYSDQSLGRFTYTQNLSEVITVSRSRNYYNDTYGDYAGVELIKEALGILKNKSFDFSTLSTDADGRVLAINAFYAGEASPEDGLWPHRWNLGTNYNLGGGRYALDYQVSDMPDDTPSIGTFIHESGHLILNIPDLYDTTYTSSGLGYHCIMAAGNYNNDEKTPAPLNIAYKDILGWANVTNLAATDSLETVLPSTGNVAYRIYKPGSTTEYFIAENRGPGDRWAEYCPDQGLVIWHVDEAMPDNDEAYHYQVAIEQADGLFELEERIDRGDSGDLYDATTQAFNDTTTPSANWYNNTASKVGIKAMSEASEKMKVRFGPLPSNTLTLLSPNGGEKYYRGTQVPITWEANVTGNLRIELLDGTKVTAVIAETAASAGTFSWKIPEDIGIGENYKIRISTLTHPVAVQDTGDDFFTIIEGSFPPGNAMPLGWVVPKGADAGWEVVKGGAVEGSWSLASKAIGDNQAAQISYTSTFKPGNLTFWVKVRSEERFDKFRFQIDGENQMLDGTIKSLAGMVNWRVVSFPISAGKHTFTWIYKKDDSFGEVKDRAWIDSVILPQETQEIAVSHNGADVAADSSLSFPKTKLTRSSSKVIVVKNVGSAPLRSLSVSLSGAAKAEFSVSDLGVTRLAPGASAELTVKFTPVKTGTHTATLRISSNDSNENPFNIKLEGEAQGLPRIRLYQPASSELADAKDTVKFGSAKVGVAGTIKTFTVANTGKYALTNIRVRLAPASANASSFVVGAVGVNRLAPGERTTFKVYFTPKKAGSLNATLQVLSNDLRRTPFDVKLAGTGTAAAKSSAAAPASAPLAKSPAIGTTSSVTVGDARYLTLSLEKSTDPLDGHIIEVSPDLIHWYSGSKYTTGLRDDETILKARDNTPLQSGVKRYIRGRVLDN